MALMGMLNGVEGAKALAEALVQNKSLAELSIKGNELGDEGVDALATALLVSGLEIWQCFCYCDVWNKQVKWQLAV
jgi:hypothetical protein